MIEHLFEGGHDVCGIDLDRSVVMEGRALRPELRLFVAGGDALPFADRMFDVLLSFDVFEHIPDSDTHLREVRRVLKGEGYYLLQTPNRWANMIFEPIRFTRKYGVRNAFKFLEYPEHCALHNYWQLTRRLEQNGFEVKYYRIPVVNEFFKRKIERFLGWFGLLALRLVNPDRFPLPLRTNFYVGAKKIVSSAPRSSRPSAGRRAPAQLLDH